MIRVGCSVGLIGSDTWIGYRTTPLWLLRYSTGLIEWATRLLDLVTPIG
nr:hypothetical protein Q903MT_gene4714 [Picea sitchensis]